MGHAAPDRAFAGPKSAATDRHIPARGVRFLHFDSGFGVH
jgi:hypothetical protein